MTPPEARMKPNPASLASCWLAPLLALTLAAAVLCGCAGLGARLEPPRISLAHIALQEVKTFETVFRLQVRVFNTNDIPLVLKALDCDLDVNGQRLATGVTEAQTTIPALGSGLVDVTVYASSLQMVGRILDSLGTRGSAQEPRALDYELSGRLHLGGRALPSRLPFSTTGTLSMDRFSQ